MEALFSIIFLTTIVATVIAISWAMNSATDKADQARKERLEAWRKQYRHEYDTLRNLPKSQLSDVQAERLDYLKEEVYSTYAEYKHYSD